MTARKNRTKRAEQLRSHRWFGVRDLRSFGHRSRAKQMGYAERDYAGKPVIAIVNTWSDLNPCHSHFRVRSEEIRRGVLQAGGFPVELPALSISEPYMKPSPMLYRNLLAMEVEEILRSQPIDGAVLLAGCDKTTPGVLMGALSMNLPALLVPAGPMLRGHWEGRTLGSGSDVWRYWSELRAGNITERQWCDMEEGIARSAGHCMTMGTASTMTAVAEALGLTLPGASSIPAVDSGHSRMAADAGARIVEMVWEDLKPKDIVTRESIENSITTDMAVGGSTNAIIHILAMAGRAGVALELRDFDALSRRTPVLANLRPSGEFLMEDFYYAGGLPALLAEIRDLLHLECRTVDGRTLGENLEHARVFKPEVIRPRSRPLFEEGGTVVLFGNLAPRGAVLKTSAADSALLKHRGPALVFRDYNDLAARIDDEYLPVEPHSVLVLQNAGPVGAPGMPEWGMLPIPAKLLRRGVRDMVRISDARMSGTSYGTCILHVSPESYVGGPLALVRDGDLVELDVATRRLELRVGDQELNRRREEWRPPPARYTRGYLSLFTDRVTQADQGCDFDFLHDGPPLPEPEIH